jgi:hypothetical protein
MLSMVAQDRTEFPIPDNFRTTPELTDDPASSSNLLPAPGPHATTS